MTVRRVVVLLAVVVAGVGAICVPAGGSPLKSHILTITDMPAGWSVTHKPASGVTSIACLRALERGPRAKVAGAVFVRGTLPMVLEDMTTGRAGRKRWVLLTKKLEGCRTFKYRAKGTTYSGSIGAESFPAVGTSSRAFALTLTVTGVSAGINLVLFRAKSYYGMLGYGNIGTPSVTMTEAFANEAVAKSEGRPVTPPTTTTGVLSRAATQLGRA